MKRLLFFVSVILICSGCEQIQKGVYEALNEISEINIASEIEKIISGNSQQQTTEYLLTDDDLKGLSKSELRIKRNEIFARHGYIFKSKDLQDYFSKQDWYTAKYEDVTDKLSNIEKQNVEILKKYEDSSEIYSYADVGGVKKEDVFELVSNQPYKTYKLKKGTFIWSYLTLELEGIAKSSSKDYQKVKYSFDSYDRKTYLENKEYYLNYDFDVIRTILACEKFDTNEEITLAEDMFLFEEHGDFIFVTLLKVE